MKGKAVGSILAAGLLVVLCSLAEAGGADFPDFDSDFLNNKNFLNNKLEETNFTNKLQALYFSSAYENGEAAVIPAEELNNKIEEQFKQADFEKLYSSVQPDTEVVPMPKKMAANKLAGIRVRRHFKTAAQAEKEVKAKRETLKEVETFFKGFNAKYKALSAENKRRFYVYLCACVKHLKAGNYSSAKSLSVYMADFFKKR